MRKEQWVDVEITELIARAESIPEAEEALKQYRTIDKAGGLPKITYDRANGRYHVEDLAKRAR